MTMNKIKKQSEKQISVSLADILATIPEMEIEATGGIMAMVIRIDEIMKEKGINRVSLARALNKKPSEITKLLSGTHNPTIRTIFNIAYTLGVGIQDFFEEKSHITVSSKQTVDFDIAMINHLNILPTTVAIVSAKSENHISYRHTNEKEICRA